VDVPLADRSAGPSDSVATIHSARLDLVSLDRRSIEAILGGRLSDAEHRLGLTLPAAIELATGLLRLRLADLRSVPQAQAWLLRVVTVREPTRRMVGFVGFHGPPNGHGEVELGYEILPGDRRHGYASEAAAALLDWAAREHGVRRFVASVSPLNAPSLGVVAKLGFRQDGSQWDLTGGTELVFRMELRE
jgi:[ribosomal protein S5]-alanine N-acetyltransferase